MVLKKATNACNGHLSHFGAIPTSYSTLIRSNLLRAAVAGLFLAIGRQSYAGEAVAISTATNGGSASSVATAEGNARSTAISGATRGGRAQASSNASATRGGVADSRAVAVAERGHAVANSNAEADAIFGGFAVADSESVAATIGGIAVSNSDAQSRGVFASDVYRDEFALWSQRLNIKDVEFGQFVPKLSLPWFLKSQGYRTEGVVSLPVLNPMTSLSQHFDRYELAPSHNDLGVILDGGTVAREGKVPLSIGRIEPRTDQPTFWFINTGETHYPYSLPGESNDLPILHGVHGVFKHMNDNEVNPRTATSEGEGKEFFHIEKLQALHEKQVKNVEHVDRLFEKLYDVVPKGRTHIIVTSDHGELFGEERLTALTLRHGESPGQVLIDKVVSAVRGFSGREQFDDDICIVC